MAGRKSLIPYEIKVNIFEKYRDHLILENGGLLSLKDGNDLYKTLSNDFLPYVLSYKGVYLAAIKYFFKNNNYDTVSYVYNTNVEDSASFVVEIENNKMLNVCTEVIDGKIRNKHPLGWGNELTKIVWKKCKSPCAWTFKRMNYRSNEFYTSGKCPSCTGRIKIQSFNEMQKIDIHVTGVQYNMNHPKNRKFTRSERQNLAKRLKFESAYKIHGD